jgi:hypothetical protein
VLYSVIERLSKQTTDLSLSTRFTAIEVFTLLDATIDKVMKVMTAYDWLATPWSTMSIKTLSWNENLPFSLSHLLCRPIR